MYMYVQTLFLAPPKDNITIFWSNGKESLPCILFEVGAYVNFELQSVSYLSILMELLHSTRGYPF